MWNIVNVRCNGYDNHSKCLVWNNYGKLLVEIVLQYNIQDNFDTYQRY